jgi:CAAX prenyl protease-like protein
VTQLPENPTNKKEPPWLDRLVSAEPRAPLMFPYLAYLLLLAVQGQTPPSAWPAMIALHTIGAIWVCWLFRKYWPPLGRPHLLTATLVGLFAAWGWVVGQHWLDGITIRSWNLGGRLPLYPGSPSPYNPHVDFGEGSQFWTYAVLKIVRATTAVPIVEELLWRGFLLQAIMSWDRYETVPYGRFHWRAFIGTALISTIQHPDNWGVSIFCWLLFNLAFYWHKSLLSMFITHAITNLALYCYVIRAGDWRFW